uniref:Zinc transporter n=3 Tax=Meloidogyne incognita group TaxID=654580 RepID=A0A914L4S0_MELIC
MKFLFILLFLLQIYFVIAHDHHHSHSHHHHHDHDNEPPHLKYTRELNEETIRESLEEEHHHGHSHDNHEGCPHAKQNQHKRMASTLPKIPKIIKKEEERPYHENSWFAFLNNPQIRLWTYSIGSTLLISAFPCFILAFIPINSNANEESPLLRTLLAFGAGGLLGDAFLHLIPHAMPSGGHSHSHSHSHKGGHDEEHEPHDLSVGTWVLVGFMTFFIVEKIVRLLRGEESSSHGHSHGIKLSEKAKHSDDEEEHEADEKISKSKSSKPPNIRVAAYLNLVADFMHNFTDGLAIGASFIAGTTVGIVTMVTVLVHEIPHEIGDFAILVQAGFSKKKAMLIQLYTAFGAIAGCAIAIWDVDAANIAEAVEQSWALPFTAGGFIYIGTVSMIPELLENSTMWQSIKELVAFLLGLFMMYLIAFFE